MRHSVAAGIVFLATQTAVALAQEAPAIPESISTPSVVDTHIGKLEFRDGAPGKETAERLYDNLDFIYAYRAFMDNMRGVSIHALRKGMRDIGMKENEVLVFSDLMERQVAVPDRQCRHDLRHGLPRSLQGPGRFGDPARIPGRRAGRLVPLGDRFGSPWSRSRPGRQISDRAARL